MNIIVSGWPGAGSSSVAILLSYILNNKYLYAGMVVRKVAELRGFSDEGQEFLDFLKQEGDEFDKKIDREIHDVFEVIDSIVLDTKIHGFFEYKRVKKSIFLTADFEVRSKRISTQGRSDANGEILTQRQNEDRERYLKLYGFDSYSIDEIKKHYDLVVDSTHETLSVTLANIMKFLEINDIPDLTELEKEYWKIGKEGFLQKLKDKNLFFDTTEIAKKIVESLKSNV